MKFTNKTQRRLRGLTAVFAVLFVLFIMLTVIADPWTGQIDTFLGTHSQIMVNDDPDDEDRYTYTSDYSTTDELIEGLEQVGRQMSAEGSVLLKNAQNALPMDTARVTLFGSAAYSPFYGGMIGSSTSDNSAIGHPKISLIDALNEADIEVNPTVRSAYENSGITPGNLRPSFGVGGTASTYTISEASVDAMGLSASDVAGYNEVGIVVIGRPSSEAADYFPGNVVDEANVAANPLSLGGNEIAAIEFAKETCDTVVVLINANNPMEIESLKQDAGVDAILWIGFPGAYGFRGVVDVLTGAANPSGHMADTYAVDTTSSPAMANYGVFNWANGSEITRDGYTNLQLRAVAYEVEAESIYTGYYYYETRYFDKVMGVANVGDYDYTAEISYPFGYGLSYTTFEQTINSLTWDKVGKTVTAEVTVTNTGDTAGKSVVQLYVSTPYGEYEKANLVEKSAIQLIGYEKTQELQPDAEETVTITVDSKYFASYDGNNAGTYIMSEGDYYFAIGDNAHDAVNNVLAAQGMDEGDGMTAAGDADKVVTDHLDALDTTTYATADNGTAITNQLEDADLNYWMDGTVTYLSRQNWTGTWPKTYSDLSVTDDMKEELANRTYDIKTTDNVTDQWGVDNGDQKLTFADMKGASWDDERWYYFLNQITFEEAFKTVAMSGINFDNGVPSVELPAWQAADGPNGINTMGRNLGAYITDEDNPYYVSDDDPNKAFLCGTMASAPVVAATFSHEMAEAYGASVGNQSLWTGVFAWWAPGTNLHRTPYCARNHEYFTEDPMLANYMSADIVREALEYGLLAGAKHFAFNDMETNRPGLSPFMTEQKAREMDLRAFQGTFEDAGALATMTAFNRIGVSHVNHHEGLLVNILRGEWGFKGIIQTDMANGTDYFLPVESILCTVNFISNSTDHTVSDGSWEYAQVQNLENDALISSKLREIMKYEFYAFANSNVTMGMSSTSRLVDVMSWWKATLLAGEIVFGVLAGLGVVAYIVVDVKKCKSVQED